LREKAEETRIFTGIKKAKLATQAGQLRRSALEPSAQRFSASKGLCEFDSSTAVEVLSLRADRLQGGKATI